VQLETCCSGHGCTRSWHPPRNFGPPTKPLNIAHARAGVECRSEWASERASRHWLHCARVRKSLYVSDSPCRTIHGTHASLRWIDDAQTVAQQDPTREIRRDGCGRGQASACERTNVEAVLGGWWLPDVVTLMGDPHVRVCVCVCVSTGLHVRVAHTTTTPCHASKSRIDPSQSPAGRTSLTRQEGAVSCRC
jgi:hypothetical protein